MGSDGGRGRKDVDFDRVDLMGCFGLDGGGDGLGARRARHAGNREHGNDAAMRFACIFELVVILLLRERSGIFQQGNVIGVAVPAGAADLNVSAPSLVMYARRLGVASSGTRPGGSERVSERGGKRAEHGAALFLCVCEIWQARRCGGRLGASVEVRSVEHLVQALLVGVVCLGTCNDFGAHMIDGEAVLCENPGKLLEDAAETLCRRSCRAMRALRSMCAIIRVGGCHLKVDGDGAMDERGVCARDGDTADRVDVEASDQAGEV